MTASVRRRRRRDHRAGGGVGADAGSTPTPRSPCSSPGRLGGKLRTTPFAGRLVDEGADAFLARVPGGRELCDELGLGDDLVSPADRRRLRRGGGRAPPAARRARARRADRRRRPPRLARSSAPTPPTGSPPSPGCPATARPRRRPERRRADPAPVRRRRARAPRRPAARRHQRRRQRPPVGAGGGAAAGGGGRAVGVARRRPAGGRHRRTTRRRRCSGRCPAAWRRSSTPSSPPSRAAGVSFAADAVDDVADLGADGVVLATPAPATAALARRGRRRRAAAGPASRSATRRPCSSTLAFRRDAVRHPLDASGFLVPRSRGPARSPPARSRRRSGPTSAPPIPTPSCCGRRPAGTATTAPSTSTTTPSSGALLADLDDLLGLGGRPGRGADHPLARRVPAVRAGPPRPGGGDRGRRRRPRPRRRPRRRGLPRHRHPGVHPAGPTGIGGRRGGTIVVMRRSLVALVAVAALVSGAGCGSSEPRAATASTTASTAPTTTIRPTTTSSTAAVESVALLSQPIAPPAEDYFDEPLVTIGRLSIPRLDLDTDLYQGLSLSTIDNGPSHWPGSALPGHFGNVTLAGHRVTHSPTVPVPRPAPARRHGDVHDRRRHLHLRVRGVRDRGARPRRHRHAVARLHRDDVRLSPARVGAGADRGLLAAHERAGVGPARSGVVPRRRLASAAPAGGVVATTTGSAPVAPETDDDRPPAAARPAVPDPRVAAALAVGGALLIGASLPPMGFWPLAFPGLVLIDRAVAGCAPWSRFRRGWLAGVALLAPDERGGCTTSRCRAGCSPPCCSRLCSASPWRRRRRVSVGGSPCPAPGCCSRRSRDAGRSAVCRCRRSPSARSPDRWRTWPASAGRCSSAG